MISLLGMSAVATATIRVLPAGIVNLWRGPHAFGAGSSLYAPSNGVVSGPSGAGLSAGAVRFARGVAVTPFKIHSDAVPRLTNGVAQTTAARTVITNPAANLWLRILRIFVILSSFTASVQRRVAILDFGEKITPAG